MCSLSRRVKTSKWYLRRIDTDIDVDLLGNTIRIQSQTVFPFKLLLNVACLAEKQQIPFL
jgi:hypothetical protein